MTASPESPPRSRRASDSSLPRRLIALAIRTIRPGSSAQIDPAIGDRSLLLIAMSRGGMLLRGQLRRPFLGGCGGVLLLGRDVRLPHSRQLHLGRGVQIHDRVTIDALSAEGVHLGNGVTLGRGSTIVCTAVLWSMGQGAWIGDHSALGDYTFVGAAGGVRIGKNVICGTRVSFHAENHRYADQTRPIRDQGVTREGIMVEDDCWLGSGAIVLDGVHIERGSVIAAGSVVTKSIPAYSIAAGVPARVIGTRDRQAGG